MLHKLLIGLFFAILAASRAQAADPPAGIVMAVTGDTDPQLSAMEEIPANVPVSIPSGRRLTFLHYARCKLVTVSGGSVTLSRADYRVEGTIEAEKDGPCPRVYALADGEGRSAGGIVARGVDQPPRWPVRPEFIFSGRRAGAVTQAAIYAEGKLDKPVAVLDLVGRRGREPSDAEMTEGRYLLRLRMRDRTAPVEIPFVAAVSAEEAPLVVVRVD